MSVLYVIRKKTGFFFQIADIIGYGHMPNGMQNAPFRTPIFSSYQFNELVIFHPFVDTEIYVIMQSWHPINQIR